MNVLFSVFVFFLLAASSVSKVIISWDEKSGKNGMFSKKAVFDVPGEIQPKGVTGIPKFVKQIKEG